MRAASSNQCAAGAPCALRNHAGRPGKCSQPCPPIDPRDRHRTSQEIVSAQHARVGACVAVVASMALRCPQALAVIDTGLTHSGNASTDGMEMNTELSVSWDRSTQPCAMRSGERCNVLPDAPALAITALADAAADPADDSYLLESIRSGTYVPSPVEVGWQIYVGSAVAAFPFVIGAYEFGKRILIQRRCEKCEGSGLLKNGRFYRKCNECGGFFPWQGWKLFFTSTASPGNGGPLLQPKGQTSVLYKVPLKKTKASNQELVETSASAESGDKDRTA
eukprot:jgi/Ulvmu1/12812/UM097_0041.1